MRLRPERTDCDCVCHREHDADNEPFCIGCTNSYSDLCRRGILTAGEVMELLIEIGQMVVKGERYRYR